VSAHHRERVVAAWGERERCDELGLLAAAVAELVFEPLGGALRCMWA
jgi:hypothetical protein